MFPCPQESCTSIPSHRLRLHAQLHPHLALVSPSSFTGPGPDSDSDSGSGYGVPTKSVPVVIPAARCPTAPQRSASASLPTTTSGIPDDEERKDAVPERVAILVERSQKPLRSIMYRASTFLLWIPRR
ncbi:hypothetical protein MY10362_003778 [Beauveria mimosiformis]